MKKASHPSVVTNPKPSTVGPVLTPTTATTLLKNCSDLLATLSLEFSPITPRPGPN
jgi:hypothetical protein